MLTLTQRLEAGTEATVNFTLSLTAEERARTRHLYQAPDGQDLYLRLPRGTVLHQGDLLQSEIGEVIVGIAAKLEPVLIVTSRHAVDLLRAAYYLGNRHVPLQITPSYLRLPRDPVLQSMLEQLGVKVQEEIAPFEPEIGAYRYGHS